MERIAPRGLGLLRRRWLYTACAPQWQSLVPSVSAQRVACASCSCSASSSRQFSAATATKKPGPDRFQLPTTPCRTRFAPSPTGYLHLGSLRTALFNYLLARATGGQFVLRIEDTDQTRLVADAERRLYKDLKWAGLSWDEGPDVQGPYGPYRQSERLALYTEHANQLLREGKAYRCFCSPEALEEHKKAAHEAGESTLYSGTCRTVSPEESDERAHDGEQFAIRFKSAETPTTIYDLVYRRFQKKHPEDDYIIMKRDGFPTYHFANVVDDRHMKITHVIRGAEWLISTPKHVELYNAFGWAPPEFAHVGLLVDANRQKLSKRDNSANITWYQQNHILPPALLNFSVLLGWHRQGKNNEFMSLNDMIDNFSLRFTKGDITVSLLKLPYMQDKHLERVAASKVPSDRDMVNEDLLKLLRGAVLTVQKAKEAEDPIAPGEIPINEIGQPLATLGILDKKFLGHLMRVVLGTKLDLSDPSSRFPSIISKLRYYIWEIPDVVLEAAFRDGKLEPIVSRDAPERLRNVMAYLCDRLGGYEGESWNSDMLEDFIMGLVANDEYAALFDASNPQKRVYKPLRWALLGSQQGLPIPHTMEILGREETLKRLSAARAIAERMVGRESSAAAERDGPGSVEAV